MKCVYDGVNKRLKLFDDNGSEVFSCEAHNDSVAPNAWRADAGIPPGSYTLDAPLSNDPNQPDTPDNNWVGEGLWFCPINNVPEHDDLGAHGGGSCVVNPLAPVQGWCPTENCIRLQNEDLAAFVLYYRAFAPMVIEVVQPG